MKKELLKKGVECASKKDLVVHSRPDFDNLKESKWLKIPKGTKVTIINETYKYGNINFIEFQVEGYTGSFFIHWITFKGGFNLI